MTPQISQAKTRYTVTAYVSGTGKVTHIIKATDVDEAIARYRIAYPGRTCSKLDAKRLHS